MMAVGDLITKQKKTENTAASSVESSGLSTRQEFSRELTATHQEASARYEIQGAILIAKQFPRNETAAFGALMRSCSRQSFAGDVTYKFPRGGSTVTGASVYLAKEAARIWGNIRFGFDIISDDVETRHIRGWAWDVETNAKASYDAHFKKLIQRKNSDTKVTEWIVPDERDLRELTNRHGAFLVRNSIIDLLPSDLIEDAIVTAAETLRNQASENVEDSRKRAVQAFGSIGVCVEELERYLGHPLNSSSPSEIAELRQIYKSIKDGNSRWSEYTVKESASDQKPATPTENALTNPQLAKTQAKPSPAAQEQPPEQPPETPDSVPQQPAKPAEKKSDLAAAQAAAKAAISNRSTANAVAQSLQRNIGSCTDLGQIEYMDKECDMALEHGDIDLDTYEILKKQSAEKAIEIERSE